MWNFRRKKKNKLGVSPETVKTVLTGEVPDGLDLELNTEKPPYKPGLRIPEISYLPEPYVEPSDKEIIEGLEMCGNYEAAGLITYLKREKMILKGKLTKLQKKYEAEKHGN